MVGAHEVVKERGDQLCSWAVRTGERYSSFEAETVAAKEAAKEAAR